MMLKSAILATVLAAAAAGTAATASAAPATAPASWSVQEAAKQIQDVRYRRHTRNRTRTVVRCVRGRRVLMRINWRGHVVSRRVIGRCWSSHRRHRNWY